MKPMVHVVDDDESLRTALLRLLKGSGFEATGYRSTGEFLVHHPAGPSWLRSARHLFCQVAPRAWS